MEEDVRKAYNEAAKMYHQTRHNDTQTTGYQNRNIERPMMFSLVPEDLSDMAVLDVGCGPGIHCNEYFQRGAEVVGLDLSDELIKFARQDYPHIDFYRASAIPLPFKDESFDIVTSSMLLGYIESLSTYFGEVKRVLKDGGQFAVTIKHPTSHMFTGKKEFVPSTTYFDTGKKVADIVGKGNTFTVISRTLEEYFVDFLGTGFTLEEFVENKPDPSLKERYENLPDHIDKIPHYLGFVWRKP